MTVKPSGSRGYELEEILRNYFLKANFYVIRSLPLKVEGEELTDVDIWLYERPSGFARRRVIVDAKFKMRPKASERLFWTKGVSEFLRVDGAYVATTDSRQSLREMARSVGVAILDGKDLDRIASSDKVETPDRLTGEDFAALIRAVDQTRMNREWAICLEDAKSSLLEDFGVASANRCLSAFSFFAEQAVIAPPNSSQAQTAVRATLFVASMATVSLDFIANEAAFRTTKDRKEMLANGIRFGNVDQEAGQERVRVAMALVSQFADNGSALARQISNRYTDAISKIPAEIIADQVARMSQQQNLFNAARELEWGSYSRNLGGFDSLTTDAKGLLASFLDFSGIARGKFANAVVLSKGMTAASVSEAVDASASLAPMAQGHYVSDSNDMLFPSQDIPTEKSNSKAATRKPRKPKSKNS